MKTRNILLGLLTLCFASPVWANWSVVQQTVSPQVQASTISVQFPTSVTAGDLIVVHVITAATNGATVSDTLGNTFTSAALAQGSTSSLQISSQIFYAANVRGGPDTVTVSIPTSTFLNFFIYEIAGGDPSTPLDVTATGFGTGLSPSTASVATTSPNDFVFVGTAHHYGYDTAGSGFIGLQSTPTGISEYQTAAFAGASVVGTAAISDMNTSFPWAVALAAFRINSGSTTTGPSLTSVQVTPYSPTLSMGQTQQFSATGTFSDGSTQNISSSVVWGSTNSAVAGVSSSGLATASAHGTTSITATSGSVSGSSPLTVEGTLTSIQVTPASDSIVNGTGQQFTATGVFSDGTSENLTSSVTWTSSNTSVATINASGLATAVSAGNVTITAGSGGITGSTGLTVTLPVVTTPPPTSSAPLVQTNYQWVSSYFAQTPPAAGGSSCSPAPCIAQTFLNSNTAGNMIFVWVSWNTGTLSLTSLSDSAGNTYVHVPGYPVSGSITDDFWVAYNVNGAPHNKITTLFTGTAVPIYLQISEYSGVATSNAFDVSSTFRKQVQCVAPCTLSTAATPSTTQASELLIAVFDVSKGTLTAGSGWVPDASCFGCLGWETDVSGYVLIEHRLVSATGSFTATISDAMAGWPAYDAYLFAFKMAH